MLCSGMHFSVVHILGCRWHQYQTQICIFLYRLGIILDLHVGLLIVIICGLSLCNMCSAFKRYNNTLNPKKSFNCFQYLYLETSTIYLLLINLLVITIASYLFSILASWSNPKAWRCWLYSANRWKSLYKAQGERKHFGKLWIYVHESRQWTINKMHPQQIFIATGGYRVSKVLGLHNTCIGVALSNNVLN